MEKNRDVELIGNKLRYVLLPKISFFGAKEDEKLKRLRQCLIFECQISAYNFILLGDLWGPLFLCMLLSFTLSLATSYDGAELFVAVFMTIVGGSVIVTVNAKLLGGEP